MARMVAPAAVCITIGGVCYGRAMPNFPTPPETPICHFVYTVKDVNDDRFGLRFQCLSLDEAIRLAQRLTDEYRGLLVVSALELEPRTEESEGELVIGEAVKFGDVPDKFFELLGIHARARKFFGVG